MPIKRFGSTLLSKGEFENYMRDEGFALNTRKAFASDVRLLGKEGITRE